MNKNREIAWPFRIGAHGGIAYVDDPHRATFQHLVQLILTRPGERVMLPDFGTTATNMQFENLDEVFGVQLVERLTAAIARWEPGIKIHQVFPMKREMGEGIFAVQIKYSVPPRDEVLSTLVEVGGGVRGEADG